MRLPLIPSFLLFALFCGCAPESTSPTATATGATPQTTPPTSPPTAPTMTPPPPTNATPTGPLAAMDKFIAEQKIVKTKDQWKTNLPKPPKLTFDDKTIYWQLATNVGPIKIKLMPKVAPMHVSSTIYLTKLGFFDGLRFHRVITGFMAQGGDPLGTGTGSPGYSYDGEFDKSVRHDRGGLLSMANRGPGTDGSQFFITFTKTSHLDDKHTIFGEVVEGMDTVKALEKAGSQSGTPKEPMSITTATIVVE